MNENHSVIQVLIEDYKNAPDGSLLIKNGDHWDTVTQENFLAAFYERLSKLETLQINLAALMEANKTLLEDKARNERHILLLQKLVAYLITENEIDKGQIKEEPDQEKLLGQILTGNDAELKASSYKHYLDLLKNLIVPDVAPKIEKGEDTND